MTSLMEGGRLVLESVLDWVEALAAYRSHFAERDRTSLCDLQLWVAICYLLACHEASLDRNLRWRHASQCKERCGYDAGWHS